MEWADAAAPRSRRVALSIPKEQLRTLLADVCRRMGLTPTAVDHLVRSAQLGRWSKGQSIFSPEDTADFVNFLVAGAV